MGRVGGGKYGEGGREGGREGGEKVSVIDAMVYVMYI